jgi:hypothetical protein
MMQMRLSLAFVGLALTAAPLSAQSQPDWLPPAALEGLAQALAPRLAHIDIGIEKALLLPAAKDAAAEMRLRAETLGVDKLMALAPRLPDLKLPMKNQPHLDAMARLGMCTYYLEARYAAPGDADVDARLEAALGPLALAVATVYLRHAYLAGGGSDAEIKAYLAGDPLNVVASAVQRDPARLQYTATQCRAVVSALLD